MTKKNVVGCCNGDFIVDSSQIQYRHSNASDIFSTSSLPISSANHSLTETETMEGNFSRHQIKPYMNNNFYRNFFDNESLSDTSNAAFIKMIDPLPLPPFHGKNTEKQTKINALLDSACGVSTQTKRDLILLPPSMSSQSTLQQDEFKRKRDLRVRDIIPSGITSNLNNFSLLPTGSVTPIYCDSRDRDRGGRWTSQPRKKAKITRDQSFKPSMEGPIGGTSVTKTNSTATKPAISMAMKCDEVYLSEYQCLIRKQIEIFEASVEEVESRDRGRNSAIVMGQVGIRCRHCAKIPARYRPRGSSYYTSTLNGLYQAAQKMTTDHFFKHCQLIPQSAVAKLLVLKQDRKRAADGKRYWAEGARSLGIRETESMGLRLVSRPEKGGTANCKEISTL